MPSLSGITNAGLAYGYFNAYVGSSTSSGLIGSYAYIWTENNGTMILSGLSTANTIAPLSSSEWSSLLSNPSALTDSLFADAAGNIYGVGMESNGSYGVYLIQAPAAVFRQISRSRVSSCDRPISWAAAVARGSTIARIDSPSSSSIYAPGV